MSIFPRNDGLSRPTTIYFLENPGYNLGYKNPGWLLQNMSWQIAKVAK